MTNSTTLLIVVIVGVFVVTNTEVFTALTHMKRLIRLENKLLTKLEKYIQNHPEIPEKWLDFVDEVEHHTAFIKDDMETFLGHPMNSYLLVRRFRGGWTDLGKYLKKHDRKSGLAELIKKKVNSSVSKQDVFGCVSAIMRIQEVYQIKAKAIADGNLSHKTLTPILDANICFELGHAYYNVENYKQARSWMIEALERIEDPGYKGELTRVLVLEFLAWSNYMTDHLIDALNQTIEILKTDKENDFAQRNIDFLTNEMQKALDKGGPYERQDEFFKKPKKKKPQYMKIYERLCRGESKKSKEEIARLKCFYDTWTHPMLIIRPLKVEVINEDPWIVMLRDVMYDNEIEYIKKKAAPMLKRATVTNPDTGELEFADYRVSKSGWLEEHLHDNNENMLKRVNRRVSAITGLNTNRNSSEALQIVNYGTAGHYEPHFDHALESYSAIMRLGMGNRIATVLFYMTDVESGGSTVFIDTEAIARPSKGDAAFWYNLMRSGEGDPYTRHAGCPVVVGSKWVCNKWIHEHGQEFLRPCTLSIDE